MRKVHHLLAGLLLAMFFCACEKDKSLTAIDEVTDDVIAQVKALGFSPAGIQKHDEGFLVEGDIVLTKEMLQNHGDRQLLRVGDEEQYRTTNLVRSLPRNITVRVTGLPSRYTTCVNNAIARYNAEGLRITFTRVTSGGNIVISAAPSGASYLASAGFPTSSGNPYNSVRVNYQYLDNNAWDNNSVTSILAHEIGHCIGFRHTDYMNRAYSCGGTAVDEGASTVGAIHIPGTPTGPDPNS
ncbi:MAG TPA: M57 family metalloprotease, partial [Phnomibacter sp.]|nr:M57 family metalloprotease [Phnomibacter sp.]